MSAIWSGVTGFFADALSVLHGGFDSLGLGDASWGWAIIALTLITRILMLPLNIKQTRSMRHMQEIAPRVKAIQKKYKVDRDLLKTNPEKYRMQKQKMNEETMALYKEEGVNPAGGCLPLIAQMPVFLALFSVLRSTDNIDLVTAPFYFFTSLAGQVNLGTEEVPRLVDGGLGSATSSAGWPGWLLIVLMGATMFITQKQMMSRNAPADDAQAQQQKIMMYVMPLFLAVISFSLPLGVLLYWVTTNFWQMAQQYIMFRDMQVQKAKAEDVVPPPSNRGKGTGKAQSRDAALGGAGGASKAPKGDRPAPRDKNSKTNGSGPSKGSGSGKKRDKRHLPGGN